MRPKGLLSFPLTPFGADDEVDLDVYTSHLEIQLAADPAGVFVACGTGEFTALSEVEFRKVVTRAVEVAGGRVPVVAGAGGGPRSARASAEVAADCGADGVLLLPPYLVTAPPSGVLRHVAYVAATSRLPITVYQRANAILDPAAAIGLLDLDNVVGIKDGIGDVEAMLRVVTAVRTSGHRRAEEFEFLNGLPTAELSAQAYRAIGIPRYSSAVLCFAPDIATAFYRAHDSGDDATVATLLKTFYLPFAELRSQVPGYAVSLVKAGARMSGLAMGSVRPPLVEAADEHVEQLSRILAETREALAAVPEAVAG
ncbi:5-dehydro-4-deoxyglucarate dehydratase [Stackebrandtia endophytica]|uniref:Probable 5-dehydro-4-deoxyglucarate dehydratase n=1 Tax=Stackebrandtia endophytica TaxID=1496996 RepID=A0A543B147_9ACTN|nr:5-dehydro-4-deoxyglucarate dehydratase [Stackebrandtia endophytica]TQL78553.1 5-dehydro-4-deoxyglucarate dehydratase [Stackebrandtia endophytica]